MYLKSDVKIIGRATRNAQSKGMTFTRCINAFLPGSTIEQVLESGNSTIWYSTDPGEQTEHDLEQRDTGHGQRGAFLGWHLQRNVGLGWSSEAVNVNIHGFLEALNVKDRSPEKFIDETYVKVSHEDGCVLRNMTLAASNTMVRERFRINRVINETVSYRWHRDAAVPMDKKQVISV